MHGARSNPERAREKYTTLLSTVRSARRIMREGHGGRPRLPPEAWHRSGTTPRAGTPRWPHTGGETPQAPRMPRDTRLARLSSFRLLAMASPHLEAGQTLLIGQHTSRIVRGADSTYKRSDRVAAHDLIGINSTVSSMAITAESTG